jgi:acyl-CoA thioesterase
MPDPEEGRTSFHTLLASLEPMSGGLRAHLPHDWLQGRTAYGGLSAALCLVAAQRRWPDLPPLRSAQFAFVGPARDELAIQPALLREGRSSAFVSVDAFSAGDLAVRALLSFGATRTSAYRHVERAAPGALPWPSSPPLFEDPARAPGLARHFESRNAGAAAPLSGGAAPRMLVWMRHRDTAPGDELVRLIALADALPPAALAIFRSRAPISTMTWTIDLIAASPCSASGWWLLESTAETVSDGYSAQRMALWNDAGEPVMMGRQMVAYFDAAPAP